MKKTLLLTVSLAFTSFLSIAQNVNIPDANFKAYLLGNTGINTNADSEIQVSEAASFAGTISINGLSITDLTGIEAFTALENLYANGASLTTLDLSNNTNLISVYCNLNSLTSLNVSNNTNLEELYCQNNSLTELDLNSNTSLTKLSCLGNNLTSLKVANGNNTNFTTFNATNNPSLTCIEVDDVAWSTTNWIQIDAGASFSLNCCVVNIPDANFKAYLVGNSAINTNSDNEIQCSEAAAFTGTINCTNLGISDLTGIEAFTSLNSLLCADNSINSIDLSSNTLLWSLNLANNPIGSVDLSLCPILYSMNVSNCNLISLDVSNNQDLIEVFCWDNSITSLDLSQNPDLQQLACQNNDLTMLNMKNVSTMTLNFFNATGNPNLTCIEVDDVTYATTNWTNIDATASFSLDCDSTNDISENELNQNVSIYPNPVKSHIHLNTDEIIESMNIVDLYGKTIMSNIAVNTTIDVTNLSNGIYFLQLSTDKGLLIKKFIKE